MPRTPLPNNIARSDLLNAIQDLADNGLPDGYGESTGYDVLFEGRRYPPKPIVGLAATAVSDFEYRGEHFTGGLGSGCFRILEQHGFQIITKSDTSPFPDEVEASDNHTEGMVTRVSVNRYERDNNARNRCIEHYGAKCVACEIDFSESYGAIGEGFIHVHHLVPIAEIGREYTIDPVNDLRPVCPNCHAMIHKRTPPFSIEEIKQFLGMQSTSEE